MLAQRAWCISISPRLACDCARELFCLNTGLFQILRNCVKVLIKLLVGCVFLLAQYRFLNLWLAYLLSKLVVLLHDNDAVIELKKVILILFCLSVVVGHHHLRVLILVGVENRALLH